MSSILENIFAAKREELERRRALVPLSTVRARAAAAPPPRDFVGALQARSPAIIAEIKRASPSRGDIMPELDPAAIARIYEAHGAACISVLTDRHFKGSLSDLETARSAVGLPVLRKDFIFDSYQIYEARAAGADCVLLIAAMLSDDRLESLLAVAGELGMAALVEVHTRSELQRAERFAPPLIGINNRDLHSFRTDLRVTEELMEDYRGAAVVVSESGIERRNDIERLERVGVNAFLIGESLLRDGNPAARLAELLGRQLPETARTATVAADGGKG